VAGDTKAFSQYVLPDEDLEVKLASFYTKIKEPVLSNVEVTFAGDNVKATQLYPRQLPDLFKGEQLVAFGRYKGKGPAAVRIRGTLNGNVHEFVQDVTFADQDTRNSYIPRLWATRRVGFLLDEIRLHGESRELKDEVTRLAREHGIVTPYTAFLILEDESRRGVPVAMQTMRELRDDQAAAGRAAERYRDSRSEASDPSQRSGTKAVANAQDLEKLKDGFNLEQQAAGGAELDKRPPAPLAPAAEAGAQPRRTSSSASNR
jgi:hypothetical protein